MEMRPLSIYLQSKAGSKTDYSGDKAILDLENVKAYDHLKIKLDID